MKKVLLLAVVFLFTIMMAYSQQTVINDPNADQRAVGSFSSIDISGGINLYLSQGNEEGVAVSASEPRYRERLKTTVENGVLKIGYQTEGMQYGKGDKKLRAYVSFKSITSLKASGASDVIVNGSMAVDKLTLKLSGASDFKGQLEVNELRVNQSGASDITISGKAPLLDIEASGASEFNGYNLETGNCNARASGASDIKITVTKELYATASGASSINYKGNGVPKEVRSNGASSVSKH